MSGEDAPISIPPTLRIEELFVALLKADPTLYRLDIVAASDRDATVPPLHCFVYCPSVAPVLLFGQNYRADVTIAVVSNIDDTVHVERKAWFTKVLRALTKKEPPYVAVDAVLIHWPFETIGEVSEDQQTADVVNLKAVATVAG